MGEKSPRKDMIRDGGGDGGRMGAGGGGGVLERPHFGNGRIEKTQHYVSFK